MARRWRRGAVALAALGPGILGLMADNDAGGMTSYLVTGGRHQLALFLPALMVLGFITVFVQDMALRVALATRVPFAKLVSARFGSLASKALAFLVHALNVLVLATEISGMAMALSLSGLPFAASAVAALALVAGLTSLARYHTMERVLLLVAILNLAFLGAVFALPHGPEVISPLGWHGSLTGSGFFLLALAGNAMAPWMVYWQQNAVVARGMQAWEIRRGRFDLGVGVIAQMTMATVVLWLGASLAGNPVHAFNPLTWVAIHGGRAVSLMFALGLFDAGLLAAVTITSSSRWMLLEAFHPSRQSDLPAWTRAAEALSLVAALAIVLLPGWGQGFLALFTQALAAAMMPITICFLGVLANDRGLLGGFANHRWQRLAWPGLVALFACLALAAWL
jgi:Mn2+/Fe2+ NRAMP family transporter